MKTQDKVGDYNDFYPFREGVGDMIDILGLDIYNILWKNCGFSKNNDDKIDINIAYTEKQFIKSLLTNYNLIYNVCRKIALKEKIEIAKILDDAINFKDYSEIPDWVVSGKWELMFLGISPHYNNNLVYDEFDNGRIDNGLLDSAKCIFSLFLKEPNNTANQKIKDYISSFLDTFGHGLYLKEKYRHSLVMHYKSIRLSPNHSKLAEHFTNSGKCKLKLGDKIGAKIDFKKALEKDKDFEEAKKYLND